MRLPPSVKNWISLAGATVALISLFMIAFLFAVTVFFGTKAAYLGLVVYILLPGVMLAGLFLIPIGMWLEVRREHREGTIPPPGWPRIDLNEPHYRNAAFIFVVGTSILLFISAIGSYEAFHYTESVAFCGTLCHAVMEPEYVAHQNSSHARVACVECHVGPGADWYVRSKLSGLYQVYAVTADVYPRPIPTPIENLRPARAVCEQCHWPQKFYAYQYRVLTHYLPQPDNPRWDIGLTLKIGAPHAATGYREGIHWHINPQVRVEYFPASEDRQKIIWVRYTNLATGQVKIFTQEGKGPEATGETGVRVMDCIDCHNRPSHNYRAPNQFVDAAMAEGSIPRDLPGINALAVELCGKEYPDRAAALTALQQGIESYYREKQPQIWQGRRDDVSKAVAGLQAVFAKNIFPYMRARWSAYPENIGHLDFPGCFRCHNNQHKTADGEAIRMDCDLCHEISSQGPPEKLQRAPAGETLEFQHPVDIGGAWRETLCSDCHNGLTPEF